MFCLALCFVIQFAIAVACLAVISTNSQHDLLEMSWKKLDAKTIEEKQIEFKCCGFSKNSSEIVPESGIPCPAVYTGSCFEIVKDSVTKGLKLCGSIALIFSFLNVSL
jgi:hypothetical protein